jgi:hypothetical protein
MSLRVTCRRDKLKTSLPMPAPLTRKDGEMRRRYGGADGQFDDVQTRRPIEAAPSTASRPAFVTLRNAPLCGTGWRKLKS